MNPSFFKCVVSKRGFKYNYASLPAEGTRRDTLLFIHGFPSTLFEWRNQVDFFRKAEFSLIVPDMLGTGETDKPADYAAYKFSDMAGDVVDILDAEQVEKAIVIGHDWWVHLFKVCTCRPAYGCCAQGKCSCLAFGQLLPRAFQGVRVPGHWLLGDVRWVRVRGIPSVDQAGSWLRDVRILGVRTLSELRRHILTRCRFFVEDGANRLIEEHVSHSESSLTAMHSSRHGLYSSNPG